MTEDVDEIIFLGVLNISNVYRSFLVWYARINEKKDVLMTAHMM